MYSKIIKNKIIYIVLAVLTICFVAFHSSQKGEKIVKGGDFYSKNDSAITKYAKLEIGKHKMYEKLGEDNMYPKFYATAKQIELTGKKEAEAIKEAKTSIIEEEAVKNFAKNNNIEMTDKELSDKMKTQYNELLAADNYSDFSGAYKKLNTTFEKEYWKNKEIHRFLFLRNKIYRSFIEKKIGKKLVNEQEDTALEKEWNKYFENMLKSFENTKEYKTLSDKLSECEAYYNKYGTNIKSGEVKKLEYK